MGRGALWMIVGGLLWPLYGIFEMLKPWGVAEVYRPDLGYEVITDRGLYLLYGLPGALALSLCSGGLIAVASRQTGRLAGLGRILAFATLAAGLLGGMGLAIGLAPLFFGTIALGTPVLGVAACVVAAGARELSRADRALLLVTGVLGLFSLPLRPLVYALPVIPLAVGAAGIALFGLGWIALGWRAMRGRD